MLYEASTVHPTANLELFRDYLLNYLSELSSWYIFVVKLKVTKSMLSARMTHFTISPLRYFTVSPI